MITLLLYIVKAVLFAAAVGFAFGIAELIMETRADRKHFQDLERALMRKALERNR